MNRSLSLRYVIAFVSICGIFALWATSAGAQEAVHKPNIVFIFADDMGYGDVGVFGADDVATPNLDAMAAAGATLTNFYAASPVCTPSRAGLLTGRYPIRMGIHHVFGPSHYLGMPVEEVTIAEVLRTAGYHTGMVGKWHLGHHERYLPLNQGFDEFFGMPYSNDMTPYPYIRGNEYVEPKVDQTQVTARLTSEAISFIDRNKDQPFFLYIAHPMPHVPLHRSDGFAGKSARGLYGDVIEELDWSVGQIMAALKERGLSDNTMVVFSSDNGPWTIMGDQGGSAGPLRGSKGTTFEGGMREPTLAVYPHVIPEGERIETVASMLDWLPTFAALSGATLPEGRELDGKNILPILQNGDGNATQEGEMAYYSMGKLEAYRVGEWKLKLPFTGTFKNMPAVVRWMLPGELGQPPHDMMLFNLRDDIGETQNLVDQYPQKVTEIQAAIARHKEKIGQTPPSITDFPFTMQPTYMVMIKQVAKIVGLIVLIIVIVSGLTGFWWGRRKKQ